MTTKRWLVAGLVTLNAVLAFGVVHRLGMEPKATAQVSARMLRGEYLIVPTNDPVGTPVIAMMETRTGVLTVVEVVGQTVRPLTSQNVEADLARFR